MLTLDLSKAFNSVKLHKDDYNLQCIFFRGDLNTTLEPETYVIVTMTYGLTPSSRILEHVMQDIARREIQNENFSKMLTNSRFVDDAMYSGQDENWMTCT